MIDPKLIRHEAKIVLDSLSKRKNDFKLDDYLSLEEASRKIQTEVENLRSSKNKLTKKIGSSNLDEKAKEKIVDEVHEINESLKDSETKSILMICEIGGSAEQEAAEFIKSSKIKKPVVGFIAGKTAPAGRRMGHAGAIISGGKGKAGDKVEKMKSCGISIAESPAQIGQTLHEKLAR